MKKRKNPDTEVIVAAPLDPSLIPDAVYDAGCRILDGMIRKWLKTEEGQRAMAESTPDLSTPEGQRIAPDPRPHRRENCGYETAMTEELMKESEMNP